jgi:hypothetical protein
MRLRNAEGALMAPAKLKRYLISFDDGVFNLPEAD